MTRADNTSAAPFPDDIGYAEALLSSTRDELRFADTKAAAVFTVVSVVAGVVTGLAATSNWHPGTLNLPTKILLLYTAVALVIGSLLSAAAMYPRSGLTGHTEPDHVAYFGDVARFSDPAGLRRALRRTSAAKQTVICVELLAVSRIALVKYRLITWSLWLLLSGAVTAAAAFAAA